MKKQDNWFLYVGPDIDGPYYGEVFRSKDVGYGLEKGIPLNHFIELTSSEMKKIDVLYDEFNKRFNDLENPEDRKQTKALAKEVGLLDFTDRIVQQNKRAL